MSTEDSLSASSSSNQESSTSDGLSADLVRMEIDAGQDQEAGSSSHAVGIDLSNKTRGAWRGPTLRNTRSTGSAGLGGYRRVSCRLPGDEIEPVLNPGEFVVFLAHFERGFGLPASDFFRQFLDFYRLQPHHLPGNAVFYLSCYATFMEAYIGIRPTRETFARFFSLRINSVQGKEIPKPKPPVQCGSCIIGSRQGSPFFKFSGLESCRLWQTTFFYVKNDGAADLINLPAFNPAPPTKVNWGYYPGTNHIETNRVVRFMEKLMKGTNICSDDIIRAFISRRVLPLKRRVHKMSEMYGPGDPTKITGLPLSKADVVLKAKQICQTDMPNDWDWGLPLSSTNPPTQEVRNCGNPADIPMLPQLAPNRRSMSTSPPQAEVGQEFLDKLASGSKRNKAPAPDTGSSQAPPAKRSRTEVLGGKEVGKRRYKKRSMPVSSGTALSLSKGAAGTTPASFEGTARTSSPPRSSPVHLGTGNPSASPLGGAPSSGRAAPTTSDHRAEDDFVSPPDMQDAGASNIGADPEAVGRAETQVPPVQKEKKKKKKSSHSSPSKAVPDTSAPASSTPPPETPIEPTDATPTLRQNSRC
ncbi:hypothetical protein QYE76_056567 [Lolium multiflorum]|uniref:Transposase (putative) gypsy type domain-containing protein n=1 Tax=Lolium multiflorum TaxID=4521 RepID=A0AAD8WPZ5_LOLMU|nr:hypothetical protein QYE76_056567 [Lolium multiflorum]